MKRLKNTGNNHIGKLILFLHKHIFYDLFVPCVCLTGDRRDDRVAEGARLESECTRKRVPGVRIPLSPQTRIIRRMPFYMRSKIVIFNKYQLE